MSFGGQYSPLSPVFPGGFQRAAPAGDILLVRKSFTTAELLAAWGAGTAGLTLELLPAKAGYYYSAIHCSLDINVAVAYPVNPSIAIGPGGVLPASTNDQISAIGGGGTIRLDALAVGVERFYAKEAISPGNTVVSGTNTPLFLILRTAPGAGWMVGASVTRFRIAVAYYAIQSGA